MGFIYTCACFELFFAGTAVLEVPVFTAIRGHFTHQLHGATCGKLPNAVGNSQMYVYGTMCIYIYIYITIHITTNIYIYICIYIYVKTESERETHKYHTVELNPDPNSKVHG